MTDEVFAEHSKTEVIETFVPAKHYGTNEARFRNYINLCLRNRFNNIYTKRKRDALGPNNWVPLGIDLDGRQSRTVDDYS